MKLIKDNRFKNNILFLNMPLFANDLNCAFTHYLEKASSTSKGVKAAYASAVLADMSYDNSDHSDIVHLREWMGILNKGG